MRSRRIERSCVRGKGRPAWTKRAFRYFSMHCWAKKQAASKLGSFLARYSRLALVKSASAFSTHSRAARFMKRLAFREDLGDKAVAHLQALADIRWTADDQVQRKAGPDG